jgi:hypothetical protein
MNECGNKSLAFSSISEFILDNKETPPMTDIAASPSVSLPEDRPMSFFQRLKSSYIEPGKAFADVNRRPSWLAIFIVISILSIASALTATMRLDQETLIRQALQSSPVKMTEAQISQAVAAQQSPVIRYGSSAFAPVSIIIAYLAIAGVFLVLYMLMGTSLNFRKILAATFWGIGPPAIIKAILSILILFLKDPDTIDVTKGVLISNLGVLADSKAHPFMASIAGSLDIFSFWSMALLAIGFAAISDGKLVTRKAGIGVVALWVVYIVGKSAIAGGLRVLVS